MVANRLARGERGLGHDRRVGRAGRQRITSGATGRSDVARPTRSAEREQRDAVGPEGVGHLDRTCGRRRAIVRDEDLEVVGRSRRARDRLDHAGIRIRHRHRRRCHLRDRQTEVGRDERQRRHVVDDLTERSVAGDHHVEDKTRRPTAGREGAERRTYGAGRSPAWGRGHGHAPDRSGRLRHEAELRQPCREGVGDLGIDRILCSVVGGGDRVTNGRAGASDAVTLYCGGLRERDVG